MNKPDPLGDEKSFRVSMGLKIAEARKSRGYSQQGLSELIDVNRPTLSKIELGNTHIDIYTVTLICRALGLEIDYFMPDDDDIYDDSSETVRVGLSYLAKGSALIKRGETIVRSALQRVV